VLKDQLRRLLIENLNMSNVTEDAILENFRRVSADLQTIFANRAVQDSNTKCWINTSVKTNKDGEEEWKKLETCIEASNLILGDIDYYDFKRDVQNVKNDDVDTAIKISREVPSNVLPSSAPVLPPPPPIPPPPPPPIKRILHESGTGCANQPDRHPTSRFHWIVDGVDAIPSTVWNSLPSVSVDEDHIIDLFRNKTTEKLYKTEEKRKKFIETLPLDRSRNIQVARNKLPDLETLKSSLFSLEGPLTKENLDQLEKCKPTEKEIEIITGEMEKNPDLPLGKADELLCVLGGIPELDQKLKLWNFKLEFEGVEKGVLEPLRCLKSAMEILASDQVFPTVLSVTLKIGNILNKNSSFGDKRAFAIDSLNKLSHLKDKTSASRSLLHHVSKKVLEVHPDPTPLFQVLPPLVVVSKVDFNELEKSVEVMEVECKQLLGLVASLSPQVKNIFTSAAKKIICLKQVHGSVTMRYTKFLEWLGIQRSQHEENTPQKMAGVIFTFVKNFKETVTNIKEDSEKIELRKRSGLKRVESMPTDLHRQFNNSGTRGTLRRVANRVVRPGDLNPRKPELSELEKTLADLLLTPSTKRRVRPPVFPPKHSTDTFKEK